MDCRIDLMRLTSGKENKMHYPSAGMRLPRLFQFYSKCSGAYSLSIVPYAILYIHTEGNALSLIRGIGRHRLLSVHLPIGKSAPVSVYIALVLQDWELSHVI